jgi:hypothetical protein
MSGLSVTREELAKLGKRVVNGVAVPIGPHSPLLELKGAKAHGLVVSGPRYRSKGEAAYARSLEVLQRAGDFREWRYEAITLRLGDRVRYTPDFYIRRLDGSIELHEVKGPYAYEDARIKLQVAAAMYPEFAFYLVRWQRRLLDSITRIRPLAEAAS